MSWGEMTREETTRGEISWGWGGVGGAKLLGGKRLKSVSSQCACGKSSTA